MMNPPEWRIGRHVFRKETPDVLQVCLVGDSDLTETRQMVNLYRALGEQGPYFVLADLEAAGTLESEGRRYMSENMRPEWFLGFIFYNTRLRHRAMGRGLIIAAELFHAVRGASSMRQRLHFVSTAAEAQVQLAQLRVQVEGVSLHLPSA